MSLTKIGKVLGARFSIIRNMPHVRNMSLGESSALAPLTKVSFDEGVQCITMDSPKTRNALSLQMMNELTQHITTHQSNTDLRIILIKSVGPVFSAGHNLKELTPEIGSNFHQSVFKAASKLMLSILQSPVPVLAVVQGLAAAAGCQLVASCDMAICSENSSFSTPGARFGIFCSTPGVALVRAVPLKVAADMLFTADSISALQALQHGLVSRVVPEENLDQEVANITHAVCSKSRAVVEVGKKFLYAQIEKDVLTAYRLGESIMVSNLALNDGQEGIRSFIEKRKPQWKDS